MKGTVNFGKNADETAAILREPVRRICSHCGWSTTGVNGTTLDAFAKHRCKPGAYARPVGLPPSRRQGAGARGACTAPGVASRHLEARHACLSVVLPAFLRRAPSAAASGCKSRPGSCQEAR